jgi:hypothetical protein
MGGRVRPIRDAQGLLDRYQAVVDSGVSWRDAPQHMSYETPGDLHHDLRRARRIVNSGGHGHASGGSDSRTYRIWAGMKQRCLNPKTTHYGYYGGRGIKVCERWMDYRNFLADMGEAPEGLSLDRINPDGNYEPGNCRWATDKVQANNKSRNAGQLVMELAA